MFDSIVAITLACKLSVVRAGLACGGQLQHTQAAWQVIRVEAKGGSTHQCDAVVISESIVLMRGNANHVNH